MFWLWSHKIKLPWSKTSREATSPPLLTLVLPSKGPGDFPLRLLTTPCPLCLQSFKTSVVSFGWLLPSSSFWLQASYLSEQDQNITQQFAAFSCMIWWTIICNLTLSLFREHFHKIILSDSKQPLIIKVDWCFLNQWPNKWQLIISQLSPEYQFLLL